MQALANTACALTKWGHVNEELLAFMEWAVVRQVSEFNPPDLANTA